MALHEQFATRLRAAKHDVAWEGLQGDVGDARLVAGQVRMVTKPMAPLWASEHPDARQVSELVFGQHFRVLESGQNRFWGQCVEDGYVGHIGRSELSKPEVLTHEVIARSAPIRHEADIKAPPILTLPLGARVSVTGPVVNNFATSMVGFVPVHALRELGVEGDDAVMIQTLEGMLGTPYVWGGGGYMGIDCSGLVQAWVRLVEPGVLRDADMQEATLGQVVRDESRQVGDFLFWPGHVAIVWRKHSLFHASGHHMAVVNEPLDAALARIEQTSGPVRTTRRHPIIAALMRDLV